MTTSVLCRDGCAPYDIWDKSKPALFTHSWHGMDDVHNFYFIPATDHDQGIFIYEEHGDYAFCLVFCSILINSHKKCLYIDNVDYFYENIFWNEEKTIIGKKRAFKRDDCFRSIVETFVKKFFGDGWRIHSYFRYMNAFKRQFKHVRRRMSHLLPVDIIEHITSCSLNWCPMYFNYSINENTISKCKELAGCCDKRWNDVTIVYNDSELKDIIHKLYDIK